MSMSLLRTWWVMVKTDAELSGNAISEEAIVLNFSGSGASCFLTKKDLDNALESGEENADR